MKKKLFNSMLIFILITIACINIYSNKNTKISNILLDNIEAIAENESGGSITGKCTGSSTSKCTLRCSCGTLYESSNNGDKLESISGKCVSCGKELSIK